MSSIVGSLAFLTLLAAPPAISAVDLVYEAPEGCATQKEFVAAVTARDANFDGAGAAKRTMLVGIHKEEDGFVGTFQVQSGEPTTNRREIHGASCSEVVDALAIVTAIALHPAEAAASAGSAAPDDPPPKVSEPVPTPDDFRLRGRTPVGQPRTQSVQVSAGTLRIDRAMSVTGYAGASMGLVPSTPLPRYDLSIVRTDFITTPDGTQRMVGPIVQARVSFLGPATYRSTGNTTDITGFSLGMALCYSPLYDTRGLVLLVCGEYGGGFVNLRTKGADDKQIQSKTVGFVTVNLGTEMQYNFGSWFHIGAKLGGGAVLGEVTAERADGSRIFASASWSAYALLGTGVHF